MDGASGKPRATLTLTTVGYSLASVVHKHLTLDALKCA
jgi:hypothetical protein